MTLQPQDIPRVGPGTIKSVSAGTHAMKVLHLTASHKADHFRRFRHGTLKERIFVRGLIGDTYYASALIAGAGS